MRPIKQPLRQFVNAQEMAKAFPSTFEAPSAEELASLHRGQFVKICAPFEQEPGSRFSSERFWCEVLSVDGDTITAEINNDLVFSDFHNLRCGDLVQFKLENVYNIMD